MKYLILAVLLTITQALLPIPGEAANDPGRTGRSVKGNTEGDKNPTNMGTVAKDLSSSSAHGNTSQPVAPQNKEQTITISKIAPVDVKKDGWDYAYIVLTGILVAVGIFTLVAIWYQAVQTRKAADAAADAAEAARLNAQAVINSERAWMIPRITQPDDRDVMLLDEKEPGWSLPIEVTFTNRGKTPAVALVGLMEPSSEKIVDPKAQQWVLDLPDPPRYKGEPRGRPGAIYVSEQGTPSYLDIPRDFLLAERPAWISGEKCLCIKGFMEYIDAFNQPHITRFCYAYQNVSEIRAAEYRITKKPPRDREFRKAAPDVYNEMT